MSDQAVKLPGKYYFTSPDLPLALKKVQGRNVTHAHDYTAQNHLHDFAELVIITNGSGTHEVNGRSYNVCAGDVFMLQDQTEHCFPDYRDLAITNVMFDIKLLSPLAEYLNQMPGFQVIFNIEPELRSKQKFRNMLHLPANELLQVISLLAKLEFELENPLPGHKAASILCLQELVVALSRSFEHTPHPGYSFARLGSLLSLLEKHWNEKWSLNAMARTAGMSVNSLLRNFKEATGVSPLQYLTNLRLERARKMLLDTNKSISIIAFESGFEDSNYFSKKFHAHYGITPSAMRRSAITHQGS
ncbi:MAG: helix-turn-helix domain-containing protein [Lentisphaerae bacterium]|nr:helix-turn-helix domain-containing protein [Lentisphaerota bacterium]